MKTFFKQLFCKHLWSWFRNIHGDGINATGCRTVFICDKCDKSLYHRDYITRDMAICIHKSVEEK